MNKARREKLDTALIHIGTAKNLLEEIENEEQEAFDNLPEGLQQGDRGQAMEEAIGSIQDAVNQLEEMSSSLEEAKGG